MAKESQVINVSMPRSGTKSLAWIFKKLGINSHHQRVPCLINSESKIVQMRTYDSSKKYNYAQKVIDRIPYRGHYLDSDWQKGLFIYQLEECAFNNNRELIFTVCIRNPLEVVNSLKHYRKSDLDINYYMGCWLEYYTQIFIQINRMSKKPFIYRFDDYITGKMNSFFLDLFDLDTPENNNILNGWLNRKVNTRGEYDIEQPDDRILDECVSIGVELLELQES